MLKRVILVSAVAGLVFCAAVPLQSTPADAGRSGCREAAKARFPGDRHARHEFKRYCKSQWKAYRTAQHG
jgi:hypothetical protein